MRGVSILFLLPLLMGAAQQDHTCQGGHNCNQGETNAVSQTQAQDQAQEQGQHQETQQTQEAQSVLNSSDAFTVNTDYKRNAPTLYVPSIHPTAPCIVTGGFGLSFPGGGGSLGGGKLDKGCEEREVARMFAEIGAIDLTLGILCNSEAVDRTIGKEDCDAWVLPPEMWYAHMPDEETELQEEMVQQQQIQQQQSDQIAGLLRRIKRQEAKERQDMLDREEADRLWYEQLDELEQKYEVD